MAYGIWRSLLLPSLLVTVSVTIIVYGRIVAQLLPERPSGSLAILKMNWVNYLIAVLIIGLPVIVFRVLAVNFLPSFLVNVVFATGPSAAMVILTVYVLPIVFLKQENAAAVLAGISFFLNNLAATPWIAWVIVVAHLFHAVGWLIFRSQQFSWSIALAISFGVLAAFLLFMSFAAALRILLSSSKLMSGSRGA